ncbi:MAG TPA: TonB-dependent receptor [Allosphingosinicella sp.]|jgi:outer membrane receptor protein involved in Fe transport
MNKLRLLNTTAIGSAVCGATLLVASPAAAQTATAQSSAQQECSADSPNYDPNTRDCVQPAEGQPGRTASGTNPATTPSDEEPTQEELNPNASEQESIVVTGSRIPRPQFEGTIPGSQVTAEQIEARAFTNTLDVLNDIPLVGPGASPFGTNGGQPASLGAAFVDLLDLGTNRTLTLVNGRRYVSGNAATLFVAGNVTGSQVDLNTIPTALLSRLDVLTVGGAVAYGSDAVAGVVNAILRDDYDGVSFSALSGISSRGDGANWRLTAVAGMNFAGNRGNVAFSLEANHDDALTGDRRRGFALNLVAPTNFRNGGVRNTAFTPSLTVNAAQGTGAFLPAASDLIPNNIAGTGFPGGTLLYSDPGAIFAINANILNPNFGTFFSSGGQGLATTDPQGAFSPSFRPQVLISSAGNVNLVPGTPVAPALAGCSVTNLTNFCNFAPNALPAGTAAQQTLFANTVVAQFAPNLAGQGTQAQRNTLAVQLLAANRQTPREFLAANPNTDINLFIGQFVTNSSGTNTFLRVPNTDPTTNTLFQTRAVPLQFDAEGNVIQVVPAVITDPLNTPSTTGGAVGGAGFNPARYTNLRVQQDRYIANMFAHYDVADWLTVYTENQYARVENVSPVNFASRNSLDVTSAENATLIVNIANPFLDQTDRDRLRAAGVTGPFVLSRTNQDIVGDNPAIVNSDTYRTVLGIKGDFGLFGRNLSYDTSFTYGRSEATGSSFNIRDIEYALAVDAVAGPNGTPVCRATLNPAAIVGLTPPGVAGTELVRELGPDGILVERIIRRTVTAEQAANCRPLNVFGFNQMSAESREYVLARTGFTNLSEQYFGQASLSGSIIDLPGGPLGFALVGEYRRESLDYQPDELSRTGATRTAALAATEGYIETLEFGAEARIPIFGEDFNIPLFRNLDITPGVRFVRQTGDAPDVRLLNGTVITQEAEGDWNTIWSIAGSWRPIRDITFRGNITRSVRQPSIVELFLGGQPAFTAVTDPCSTGQIGLGPRPATRRANCEQAVINAGLATNQTQAAAFLNTFVPSGSSITGTFAGSPGLAPERGRSWTVGGVFAPQFVPGRLQLSADYINVEVRNQIIPTQVGTAVSTCFDSPAFPDTSPEVGVNVCNFFNRRGPGDRPFEVDNGFNSGFINLGALRVKAINMTANYDFPLEELLGSRAGSLQLFGNAYHLIDYLTSNSGDFGDGGTTDSAGTFSRPSWEVQLRARYENRGFFTQWTTNWQEATRIFTVSPAGTNTANETQDLLFLPSFMTHDAAIGYTIGEDRRFGLQFTVRNVFDKNITGPFNQVFGLATSGRIDDIGRRFFVQANLRF